MTKPVVEPTDGPSMRWTVGQLRAYAIERDISLGTMRVKAEILERILGQTAARLPVLDSVLDATDRSIAKAVADKILDPELQAGPIAAIRILAHKIDTEDDLREAALAWADENDKKAKPPPIDNVSVPTYLKFCESLGLTVAAVKAAPAKGGESDGDKGKGSKLGHLRSVHGSAGGQRA